MQLSKYPRVKLIHSPTPLGASGKPDKKIGRA